MHHSSKYNPYPISSFVSYIKGILVGVTAIASILIVSFKKSVYFRFELDIVPDQIRDLEFTCKLLPLFEFT